MRYYWASRDIGSSEDDREGSTWREVAERARGRGSNFVDLRDEISTGSDALVDEGRVLVLGLATIKRPLPNAESVPEQEGPAPKWVLVRRLRGNGEAIAHKELRQCSNN